LLLHPGPSPTINTGILHITEADNVETTTASSSPWLPYFGCLSLFARTKPSGHPAARGGPLAANALDSAKSGFPYTGGRSYGNKCLRDTVGSCFRALAPKSYRSLTARTTAHLARDGLHLMVHSRCVNTKILFVKLGLLSPSSPSQPSPKPSPRVSFGLPVLGGWQLAAMVHWVRARTLGGDP